MLRLRPGNNTSKEPMENSYFSKSKEGPIGSIKCLRSSLLVFFYANGIVHKGICSSWTKCESTILSEGVEKITLRKKRPQMCSSGDWFLHHDNAPAHTALSVQQFLVKNKMTVIPHPPYSPDLALCDFFLFPRIKRKRFADVSEVKKKTLEVLNNISTEEFQKCFQ